MGRITDKAELDQFRRTYIPAAVRALAQRIVCKGGEAEAFVWTEGGKPSAVCFLGAAQKPWSGRTNDGWAYSFKSEERRRAFIAAAFETARGIEARQQRAKAEKAAARAKPHALAVGDVLKSSWGYDQTNIEFFEVTKLIGAQMVEIREIGQQSQETGFMSGECVPAPGAYIGKPRRVRVSEYGDRDSVKVHSFASAYKMKPKEIAGMKLYGTSHWTAYA